MPVVETRQLTRRYGSVVALDRVDVVVEHGCTGLVGSNGAGKSTLLKVVLGLLRADQGEASVLGHDIAAEPLAARAKVGYLPEGQCLPPDMTAADFVGYMAQLAGLPPRQARERASEVCYQVGLEEERYRAVGGFSTGMQQRVKLAAALVHDPELLLLDEPTDGMDPQGRLDMLALIQRVRAELGIDVVVSTHLLGDVERVCDRVVMVHGGRVLAQGTVAEVSGEAEPGYGVQLGAGGEAERAALAAAGLDVSPTPGGEELLVRSLGDGDAADLVRDVAAERGWPLRRLTPRAASLEQVFLRLAGRSPDAAEPRPEAVAR